MNGLIGPETPIDDLLSQYFPGRPESWVYQTFESEQAALLAALLIEQRGDPIDQSTSGSANANYYSTEVPQQVKETAEQKVEWNFPASAVTVYGFDAPITVAFTSQGTPNREISLSPDNAPFELSPPGGLGASTLWYSKQDDDEPDTELNVIAFA